MVGTEGRGIQVLNISNVNAQGKTVLNDGKLLELIRQYPLLYNPRVRTYGDNDYTMWAWKQINASFNRSYENDPFAAFSVADLMDRWQILKPLIQCLSKAYDLQAIPSTLRQSVMQISTELDNQPAVPQSNDAVYTSTQKLLQEHISDIEKLPMEKRLELEKEILNLMLDSEMEDHKRSINIDNIDLANVNRESDEFLQDIGFKVVFETAMKQQSKKFTNSTENGSKPNNIFMKNGSCIFNSGEKHGKWVPLGDADRHVRPCYVSIKRMNLEDYLPLSKIKKFYKRK